MSKKNPVHIQNTPPSVHPDTGGTQKAVSLAMLSYIDIDSDKNKGRLGHLAPFLIGRRTQLSLFLVNRAVKKKEQNLSLK